MIYTQPVVHDLPRLRAPALLVIGQADRTAPGAADVPPELAQKLGNYPELGQRAAAAIPGAKLVALDGVGHVPQLEAFERWRSALLEFFGFALKALRRGVGSPFLQLRSGRVCSREDCGRACISQCAERQYRGNGAVDPTRG